MRKIEDKDVESLNGVTNIDFLDIFPRSEKHKNLLDLEDLNLGYIIEETNRGSFYVFNIDDNSINTRYKYSWIKK